MKEWDRLGINELDVFEDIERDDRALVSRDGEVSVAKVDEVSRTHRLCLRVFQTRARQLFVAQESKIETQKMLAAQVAQRGGGHGV